jgi:hypothetical protein
MKKKTLAIRVLFAVVLVVGSIISFANRRAPANERPGGQCRFTFAHCGTTDRIVLYTTEPNENAIVIVDGFGGTFPGCTYSNYSRSEHIQIVVNGRLSTWVPYRQDTLTISCCSNRSVLMLPLRKGATDTYDPWDSIGAKQDCFSYVAGFVESPELLDTLLKEAGCETGEQISESSSTSRPRPQCSTSKASGDEN